ncbi:tetratricopeptide repeat protein [Treponema sp.]|uniref:tetratricopeptide repeat protein n=1 Tax=Treponema sp. TaxID=166 RepID=UPI00298EB2B8|nr:tetratricopeptide repeat protein [Treponema sp.]MCR5612099.1 tetratricopeptide repeat protein [Treponema sp.]
MSIGSIVFIIFLASGVGLLFFFVIKSIVSPKKIEGLQRLVKQGKIPAAIKLAKALIQKDPQDYLAHYYLGKAYLKDNKSELALMELKYVDQHAVFDEKLPELEFRQEIAPLYVKFNQPDDALKQYLLLTKLNPRDAENFYNVAKIYDAKGKADGALGFYDKTIKLNKRHVKAHAAMGLLLFRAKQYQDAKKEIDLAISLSPETFSSYYYLGKILKENKDFPGAVKAFEKAGRDPEFRQKALVECGTCYMAGNSLDNAINCFERAIASPKDAEKTETLYARYFLASCYEKTRKIEKAIEHWEYIYARNRSFRDVATKLSEYKDLQANDSLKEYLTCSEENFIKICQKTCLTGMGLEAQQASMQKWGCEIVATEAKNADWRSMRKQTYLVKFFRETDPLEDFVVRKTIDEIKTRNCSKAFICSSSGFTRTAANVAENRPCELIPKEQLEKLLDKASK